MRTQVSNEQHLNFAGESSLKIVNDYREKYGVLSMILDDNPDLLAQAHQDWVQLLSTSDAGRDGYTSEQLLRVLIVMFIEGKSYRNTIVLIDNSEFLQHFVRLGVKSTMDFTFLNRAYSALGATTIDTMNAILISYAITEEMNSREKQRMDTTVYETNIHYPTDSSLLRDSFCTLAPLKRQYTTRIHRVRWIHGVGQHVYKRVFAAGYDVVELNHYLPLVLRIVDQADCRIIQDETVPPVEKLYSLFEEHTELIVRGKAGKPIEFGHKILVAQTGEKYIHHYQVMEKWMEDKELLVPAIEAHKDLFGDYPDLLSTDKGFYESMKQIHSLEEIIPVVSISKKGRRTQAEVEWETTDAFIDGQRFRAESEGSISVLKRAFKLGKCFFKGCKNYAASVGFAVLCHNLVLLTRL